MTPVVQSAVICTVAAVEAAYPGRHAGMRMHRSAEAHPCAQALSMVTCSSACPSAGARGREAAVGAGPVLPQAQGHLLRGEAPGTSPFQPD
jgi:hypothetical protein